MGNRCVIATEKKTVGIYLHWNGGRGSVEGFLLYCKLQGYRKPETDNYGWARLCQVIGNFFGGTTSIGIDVYKYLDTDNGDNGTYIIKDWAIVKRLHFSGEEQEDANIYEFLHAIDKNQPEKLFPENATVKEVEELVLELERKYQKNL